MLRLAVICLLGLLSISLNGFSASAQSCSASPVAVQILGSGGPRLNPFRSSSSYLLWLNGQARILIDLGGGAHQRFGQSQAKLEDLWMVGISHLHPDHVSDLPAFLWQILCSVPRWVVRSAMAAEAFGSTSEELWPEAFVSMSA